jgi:hypothetical protein
MLGRWPWRSQRQVRLIVAAVVVLAAVGAIAAWGPIGIGNGPLNIQMGAAQDSWNWGSQPTAFALPLYNSGGAVAVVDRVELVDGTRFPAPHLLNLGVLTSARCGGPWPALPSGLGFIFESCGGPYVGPLIGHGFGRDPARIFFGFPAAAEVAAPRPGNCWVLTKIVIRYHVGIRYYTATDSYQLAVCRGGASLAIAAINAAKSAS